MKELHDWSVLSNGGVASMPLTLLKGKRKKVGAATTARSILIGHLFEGVSFTRVIDDWRDLRTDPSTGIRDDPRRR